jgi:predicted GTPase
MLSYKALNALLVLSPNTSRALSAYDSETYVTLIDTGGLTNQDNIIDNGIQLQVLNALEESDVIYFIVPSALLQTKTISFLSFRN